MSKLSKCRCMILGKSIVLKRIWTRIKRKRGQKKTKLEVHVAEAQNEYGRMWGQYSWVSVRSLSKSHSISPRGLVIIIIFLSQYFCMRIYGRDGT